MQTWTFELSADRVLSANNAVSEEAIWRGPSVYNGKLGFDEEMSQWLEVSGCRAAREGLDYHVVRIKWTVAPV